MQQLIGYSDEKRKVAISLDVDPYSTNTVLQQELDGIAWASFAGGMTFSSRQSRSAVLRSQSSI